MKLVRHHLIHKVSLHVVNNIYNFLADIRIRMSWRLLDTGIADPFYVTAVDDAIAQARRQNICSNTLHFYQRHPAAVSIGRSRCVEDDVDVQQCNKNNVKIVRRTSGGGSIFTDQKCLIYSLVFNKKNLESTTPQAIFTHVCTTLVKSLQNSDIPTVYKPPNDLLLQGKKISGSGLIIKDDVVLIHGTLLVDTNLELMSDVLKATPKTPATTLTKELNYTPDISTMKTAFAKGFQGLFDTTFKKGTLTSYEKQLITTLLKARYHNDQWNFMR